MSDKINIVKKTNDFLDELLFTVGDSAVQPTEDELLNMIIGFKTQLKFYSIQNDQQVVEKDLIID